MYIYIHVYIHSHTNRGKFSSTKKFIAKINVVKFVKKRNPFLWTFQITVRRLAVFAVHF